MPATLSQALRYLEESHQPLQAALAGLPDSELAKPRSTNWGEIWSTEKILWTLIQHDVYHGAQIWTMRKIRQSQL